MQEGMMTQMADDLAFIDGPSTATDPAKGRRLQFTVVVYAERHIKIVYDFQEIAVHGNAERK